MLGAGSAMAVAQAYDIGVASATGLMVGFCAGVAVGLVERVRRTKQWLDERESSRR